MSDLLAQIVLARRDVEDNGWMNILVVIVMIVFWVVVSIIKTMKTKSDEQEQPSRVPSRKPPVRGRAGSEQRPGQARPHPAGPAQHREHRPATQKKRTTLADLRAAARKFATEAEQAFQPPTTRPTPEPQQPPPKPVITPAATLSPDQGPGGKQAAAVQVRSSEFLSDLLSDYADPEKLRRAILHYEILGPPLSLRD